MSKSDKPKCWFFIGAARSGKSTLARQWEREPSEFPRVVVHADTLRLAYYGSRYNSHLEPTISNLKDVFIKKYTLLEYEILVDGTHTSESSIRRLLQLRPDAIPIVVPTPLDECIRRAHATNQPDLEQPIKRMFRNMSDLVNKYYIAKTEEYIPNIYDVWEFVVNQIRDTVKPIEHRIV